MSRRKIAVIGLGYVGLPVAVAFAREGFAVTGFDIDASRVRELESAHGDRTPARGGGSRSSSILR